MMFKEADEVIRDNTGAKRVSASVLGVTLHFEDGHEVLITKDASQAIQTLIYDAEKRILDQARAELRRTY